MKIHINIWISIKHVSDAASTPTENNMKYDYMIKYGTQKSRGISSGSLLTWLYITGQYSRPSILIILSHETSVA